ncbi:MAG: hypothetical protein AABW80_05035 [Nanoarchaeota archaeon]
MNYQYFLQIPGFSDKPETDLGKAELGLEELTRFRPGKRVFRMPGINYGRENWQTLSKGTFVYLNQKKFEGLRELLTESHVSFQEGDVESLELCCGETTAKASKIVFYNWHNEPIVCVSPEVKMEYGWFRAFLSKRTKDDDFVEEKFIREWQEIVEESVRTGSFIDDLDAPDYSLRVYESLAEARKIGARRRPGRILKKYPNGVVVKGRGPIPMDDYFKPSKGIAEMALAFCERCFKEGDATQRKAFYDGLRRRAIEQASKERYSLIKAAQVLGKDIGQERVGIRTILRKTVFDPFKV